MIQAQNDQCKSFVFNRIWHLLPADLRSQKIMLDKHYVDRTLCPKLRRRNSFWDREREMREIRRRLRSRGFGYVTGRRRVGKTATLVKACEAAGGFYHQAVEGTPEQQLLHLAEEIARVLPVFHDVVPRTWNEFFRLLSLERLPRFIVFDEFPYWVQGDPNLPSLVQKWIDHDLPKSNTLMVVSGSSQSMLYSQFLREGSPLYGRASFRLHLEPLSYTWFCKALKYKETDPLSFVRFSLVGGVPYYWKLLSRGSVTRQADELYFQPSALLAEEPALWIREEGITGNLPKAILDLIGRGVNKPNELGARLGVVQGNLSRPLALLLDLNLIQRELPFGESPRTTKKVLYRIHDPALSFYYGVFLPNRSVWKLLKGKERLDLLERNASRQWEYFCRELYPGAARYWEPKIEIDLVAPLKGKEEYIVAECKWTNLNQEEKKGLLEELKKKFEKTKLAQTLSRVQFRIFSKEDLPNFVLTDKV